MKCADNDEHTGSPISQFATTKHAISFCDDMDYPTLWQLTTEEIEDIENYYVPALVSVVTVEKVD